MEGSIFIVVLSAAIVAILVGRAIYVVRQERDTPERGAAPGKGDHVIHADYSSGLSGHSTSYKVPRDPQAYARRFVPKSKR
ncbi:MAG: hypothetical protein AAFZ02_00285 [Pseudomonadota bacterium]